MTKWLAGWTGVVLLLTGADNALAQAGVVSTPSRAVIEEASRESCSGVSEVVTRCAPKLDDGTKKPATDPLTKSREATKEAFDRKDARGRAEALDPAKKSDGGAAGSAQRLDTVNVEGTGDKLLSVEEVLQRALNPGQSGVPGPNGTVSHFAPDGVRYDCVQKCVGPACCAKISSMPNPARDSNSIGR